MRPIRRWGGSVAGVAVLAVSGAAVASAAVAGSYSGRTTQKQRVSFSLSAKSRSVRSFKIVVLDKCPDGHTLVVTGNYPTMAVKNGKFGGSFVPSGGHPGEGATLSGKLGRRTVTGSVRDTSFSPREGALCHGSAGFTASRR